MRSWYVVIYNLRQGIILAVHVGLLTQCKLDFILPADPANVFLFFSRAYITIAFLLSLTGMPYWWQSLDYHLPKILIRTDSVKIPPLIFISVLDCTPWEIQYASIYVFRYLQHFLAKDKDRSNQCCKWYGCWGPRGACSQYFGSNGINLVFPKYPGLGTRRINVPYVACIFSHNDSWHTFPVLLTPNGFWNML